MHNSRESIPIPKGRMKIQKGQIGPGYLQWIRGKKLSLLDPYLASSPWGSMMWDPTGSGSGNPVPMALPFVVHMPSSLHLLHLAPEDFLGDVLWCWPLQHPCVSTVAQVSTPSLQMLNSHSFSAFSLWSTAWPYWLLLEPRCKNSWP